MRAAYGLCVAVLVLAGCEEADMPFSKSGGAAALSGERVFQENCAVCHGVDARGEGPAAQGLDQHPANLRLISERAGGRFPADDILAKVHGYSGPGHFGDMPDFGALIDGPKVIWTTQDGQEISTSAELVALVRYLEGIQE